MTYNEKIINTFIKWEFNKNNYKKLKNIHLNIKEDNKEFLNIYNEILKFNGNNEIIKQILKLNLLDCELENKYINWEIFDDIVIINDDANILEF